MGYDIASGMQVIINAWAIGRDPLSWAEPGVFRPERFLNFSNIDFQGHEFELIPFGAARKGCPGIQFAASVMVANLVYKFDFALPDATATTDSKILPLIAVMTPC